MDAERQDAEIQRYECYCLDDFRNVDGARSIESPNGEWVLWTDAALALEKAREEAEADKAKLIEALETAEEFTVISWLKDYCQEKLTEIKRKEKKD